MNLFNAMKPFDVVQYKQHMTTSKYDEKTLQVLEVFTRTKSS